MDTLPHGAGNETAETFAFLGERRRFASCCEHRMAVVVATKEREFGHTTLQFRLA